MCTLFVCSRPRGFGFVEFRDPRDAEDALYHVDRNIFGGREISVVMSKESRKTPKEMMLSMFILGAQIVVDSLDASFVHNFIGIVYGNTYLGNTLAIRSR